MGGRPPDYANYMRARSTDVASQQGNLQPAASNTATRAPRGQAAQNRPYPLTFVVDHLATFSALSRQGRVLSPQDGVSQFRTMARKTGVWILRVRLVVSEKELVVLEGDTGGEVMETFPISQVSRPAACLDPNETHDNILLFTVLPDPRTSRGMDTISSSSGAAATPEIHFFQCTDASAQDVVDLIIASKTGRLKSPTSSSVSSQPVRPVEAGPSTRTKEFEQAAQRTADAVHVYRQRVPAEGQGRRTAVHSDVSNGERAVHWVELLNRCFDDIERFMGRLQAVADAYRELEERRKKGRDNRKDRMLTLKMNIRKNPSHEEFVDIFQKFRLSFNLLAVLRQHIHDPNAPELVHFLFTPLSLVLEASQDPMVEQSRGDGRAGTAARVREPPMSAGAVELLSNCLTSKEIELWKILAETWTVPARPGYLTSYVPKFYDGWSPPPAWLNGLYDDVTVVTSANFNQPIAAAPVPVVDHMAYGMHPYYPAPVDMGRSNGRDNIWQDPHLIGSIDRQTHFREAPPPPQGNWSINRLIPNAYKSQVQPQGGARVPTNHASAAAANKRTDRKARYYEVMKNRSTNKSDEISVQKGEIVEVLENKNSYWKITNNRGQTGYVPKTCLQPFFGNLQVI